MAWNCQSGVNIGPVERVASVLGGVAALLTGAQGGPLRRLVATPFAMELIRRGFTGHCFLYGELDRQTIVRAQDEKLDEMLAESSPASDPPSTY